jgi:hypothetical protein
MEQRAEAFDRLKDGPVVSRVEDWRGTAGEIDLSGADADLLDLVLCVYPDLRITAYLGQLARSRHLPYPVTGVDVLVDGLAGERLELGEHVVDATTLREAMAGTDFPLAHEGELLSAVHRALVRCRVQESLRRHGSGLRGNALEGSG